MKENYIDLIQKFEEDMQNGKKFTIKTTSTKSEFICYMVETSKRIQVKTSTGSERNIGFIDLKRYFKGEAPKDDKSYVKAICEMLKNRNQDIAKKRKQPVLEESKKVYPRDENEKKEALILANYKCEIDEYHLTFISKYTEKNYVEAHHLIPISQYNEFKNDIDVKANIVSLCPICHRKLHFGINKDRDYIIEILYKYRKNRLKNVKIEVSLEKLKNMYK